MGVCRTMPVSRRPCPHPTPAWPTPAACTRTGSTRRAEQAYRFILSHQPNHPDVLLLMGVLQHETGRHEDAVATLKRGIAVTHDSAGVAAGNRGAADGARRLAGGGRAGAGGRAADAVVTGGAPDAGAVARPVGQPRRGRPRTRSGRSTWTRRLPLVGSCRPGRWRRRTVRARRWRRSTDPWPSPQPSWTRRSSGPCCSSGKGGCRRRRRRTRA